MDRDWGAEMKVRMKTALGDLNRKDDAAGHPFHFGDPLVDDDPVPVKPNGHGELPVRKPFAPDIEMFMATKFPPREKMLTPWLTVPSISMIYGPRGIGKTMLMHAIAMAVASGGSCLTWVAPQPYKVLLLDGEMPREDLRQRLEQAHGAQKAFDKNNLRIACSDDDTSGLPDMADPKSHQFYADLIGDAKCVEIDNISTLCRSIKENDADSWLPVQMWSLEQRRAGRTVVFGHHAGKGGQQRGSSRKEDIMDTVIALKRPLDYTAEQGARFQIVYEKARGFYGPDAATVEAHLKDGIWHVSDPKPVDDVAIMKAMYEQGHTYADIAEKTGVTRQTVSKRLNGAGEV